MLHLESSLTFSVFIISLYGYVWVYLIWDPLCFLYLDICFCLLVCRFSAIISSSTFLIPFCLSYPSRIQIMYQLACFILSHSCFILLSFFFILLSVYCPYWVISIILSSSSVICYSALFILLLIAFSSLSSQQMSFIFLGSSL